MIKRYRIQCLALCVVGSLVGGAILRADDSEPEPGQSPVDIKVQLEGAADRVHVIKMTDGSHRFRINQDDGTELVLTPDEFAQRIHSAKARRGFIERILNISSPMGMIWVAVGFIGQALFTGRMVVQWLVSEKQKQSVVPVAFWWMSLGGASMLMLYFIWRKDIVGVLGQSTGWFIYVRNLWLIYGKQNDA